MPQESEGMVSMPVTDYTDKSLVARAVRNAKPNKNGPSPRWVAVMDTFALGSTYAVELCRTHELDPDEEISGVTCISCNP